MWSSTNDASIERITRRCSEVDPRTQFKWDRVICEAATSISRAKMKGVPAVRTCLQATEKAILRTTPPRTTFGGSEYAIPKKMLSTRSLGEELISSDGLSWLPETTHRQRPSIRRPPNCSVFQVDIRTGKGAGDYPAPAQRRLPIAVRAIKETGNLQQGWTGHNDGICRQRSRQGARLFSA